MAATKRKPKASGELRLVASHGALLAPPSAPPRAAPSPPEGAPSSAGEPDRPDALDVTEVPAAVLCARCGFPDCTGTCEANDASGVFVLVPWERGNASFSRLFATSRAATVDAEAFFERLGDGPIGPALSFAIASELVSVVALALVVCAPIVACFPHELRELLGDPGARRQLFVGALSVLPAFALVLVAAHVFHGLSIDVGASRQGARSHRSRALRFGLYACGWDLVLGPVGAFVLAATGGPKAVVGAFSRASGLPSRATLALLASTYRLEGDPARRALRVSYAGAAIATVLSAAFVVVAVVKLVLA